MRSQKERHLNALSRNERERERENNFSIKFQTRTWGMPCKLRSHCFSFSRSAAQAEGKPRCHLCVLFLWDLVLFFCAYRMQLKNKNHLLLPARIERGHVMFFKKVIFSDFETRKELLLNRLTASLSTLGALMAPLVQFIKITWTINYVNYFLRLQQIFASS